MCNENNHTYNVSICLCEPRFLIEILHDPDFIEQYIAPHVSYHFYGKKKYRPFLM